MYVACEILIEGRIFNGYFTQDPLSDAEKINLAVNGYQSRPGYLIYWGELPRAYLHKIPGMPCITGSIVMDYLSLT